MQLGMVGLGRMGANMTRRLMHGGHTMVVSDLSADAVKSIAGEGAVASSSLDDLVGKLSAPRAVWIMVPAGEPTEKTVQALVGCMQAGDTIIDGGNSYFKDDVRRSKICAAKDVHYIDVGTSGGVWGLERGYCMMIGGPKQAVQRLDPIFKTLAPGRGDIPRTPGREKMAGTAASTAEDGYIHCGPSGSGHFVKMVTRVSTPIPAHGSISSVTTGPTGQNVSKPLARVHCPSLFCRSRAVTSFTHV